MWQKPTQHCKTTTLQIKINLKNRNNNNKLLDTEHTLVCAREGKMDAEGEKVKIKNVKNKCVCVCESEHTSFPKIEILN